MTEDDTFQGWSSALSTLNLNALSTARFQTIVQARSPCSDRAKTMSVSTSQVLCHL